MGPFLAPLTGRFTRADVVRSRVAHNAVFGGLPAADLIYVHGYLDHPYTVNPIRIRAYDRAGNPVAAVRLNDIRDHDYTADRADPTAWLANPDHGYVVSGTDRDGAAIDVFGDAVADIAIQDFVADRDGTIYCAMAPGHHAAYTPKPAYSMGYVLDQLSGLTGTAYDARRYELANQVSIYFYGHFRKYRRGGDRIPFPELHGGLILSIAVDESGNIYCGGVPVGAAQYMLRKYDSAGALLWSAGTSDFANSSVLGGVHHLAVDASGNVYVVGMEGIRSFFKKYSSSGSLQWTRRLVANAQFKTVAIDEDGNLYTGGYSAGYTIGDSITTYWFNDAHSLTSIQKWDSDGSPIATRLLTSARYYPTAPPVFSDAELYLITYVNGELHCRAMWSLTDDPYWVCGTDLAVHTAALSRFEYVFYTSFAYEGEYDTIAVDRSGRQYLPRISENRQINIGGVLVGNPVWSLAVYDAAGDQVFRDRNALGDAAYPYDNPLSSYVPQWSVGLGKLFTPYFSSGDQLAIYRYWVMTGRAFCLIEDSATPALPLPMRLGTPGWLGDLYSTIPPLAVGIAIGAPVWFRDYVGPLRPTIYRLYLTGSPNIELAMASFQIRRNLAERWLSVVIPAATVDVVAAIAARSDGEIVIMRGVRLANGTEMIDELIRAPLGTVRVDTGSSRASVTLDGSATEVVAAKTRVLHGVSYQAMSGGLRQVRCDVDTYLAPGDTADLGAGASMTVGQITINVNPDSAIMSVSESA